jgi:hypothetical protein
LASQVSSATLGGSLAKETVTVTAFESACGIAPLRVREAEQPVQLHSPALPL